MHRASTLQIDCTLTLNSVQRYNKYLEYANFVRAKSKKKKTRTCVRTRSFYVINILVVKLYDSAEAHEGHGEKAGGEEGDRRTFHSLRHLSQRELLADTGEQDERQTET